MTDNNFNLRELEDLKQAYQLIDEKLDGKEIVTPEQIRKATLKNIGIFTRLFKLSTTWSLYALTPILILTFAFSPKMTTTGIWILCIYMAIDILLHILLIRRINRADHSELDLRTLLREELFYNKSAFALSCVGFAFWIVFNYFFLGIGASIAMLVLFLFAIGTKTKFFTRKINFREIVIPEYKEPGKFRKAVTWFFLGILIIITLIFTAGIIYNAIGGTLNPMEFLARAGYIIITIAFIVNALFLGKYRKGEGQKMSKVITITVAVGMVMVAIPIVNSFIINHTINSGELSPLFIGILTLFMSKITGFYKNIK